MAHFYKSHTAIALSALYLSASQPRCLASDNTFDFAEEVALIIVGGEECGLEYDQDAFEKFIAMNIGADNLEFSRDLNNSEVVLRLSDSTNLTQIARNARCAQVKRNAEHFGFLKH